MESPFYSYFYISTDCLSNTMDTAAVEAYLCKKGFQAEVAGHYDHENTSCSIQLMKVKSYDSWSPHDYNAKETNYISITVAKDVSDMCKIQSPRGSAIPKILKTL